MTPVAVASHGLIVAQLALVFAVFHAFAIERSSGFLSLTTLIIGGFAAHAALPMRYRAPFFVALAVATFTIAIGPEVIAVVAVALALIGVCHLPVGYRLRVGILVLAGALLALLAERGITGIESATVRRLVPVIASMFMFRLIVYMYDLRHERSPVSPWMRVAYFFLPLNATFLLFPVVDYGAFRRNYYDKPAIEIYQRGVRLILRGAIHLLLYRYIYYYWSPPPDVVYGIRTVAIYMASAWLAYLHVSGLFHLIVGVLCLFGFNLPETNRLYLLASSPNDLWRRVNVYWKDFMQKIFYMPVLKALQKRKLDMKKSMLLATVVVFVATWLLHSYQWFWLFGGYPLSIVDGVFWGVLGVAVLVNTFLQLRSRPAGVRRAAGEWRLTSAATHVLKVIGMFALMSIMFSWWNTRDPATWAYLVRSVGASEPRAFLLLGLALAFVLAAGVAAHYSANKGWTFGFGDSSAPSFRWSVVVTLGATLMLLALSRPEIQQRLGRGGRVLAALEADRLNLRDANLQNRGYYEAMIAPNQPTNPRFASRNEGESDMVPIRRSTAVRFTGDDLIYEFVPSKSTRSRGTMLHANAFGMRDKEYPLAKPDSTYRIALLGASVVMASGVEQPQGFEALVEERLNRERPSDRFASIEILNFAVPGYAFHQFAATAERKVFKFQPDVVLMAALAGDNDVTMNVISSGVADGIVLDSGFHAILEREGITRKPTIVEIKRDMGRSNVIAAMRALSYRRIADMSRANGAIPVFVYVPRLESDDYPPGYDEMARDARAAGMVVFDLRGVYAGLAREELMFYRDNVHPNARGHKLIADRLYAELVARAGEVGLAASAGSGNSPNPRK